MSAPRLQTNVRFLHFGPWSAELYGDELAQIRFRNRPVLRGLRAVVRNRNWLTLTPRILSAHRQETDGSLRVVLDIAWTGYTDRYTGQLTLVFEADSVTASFHGTADEEFAANRIGLVVLHRPDDAGRPVTLTSPKGDRTDASFPTSISPHQPFEDIAALDWERGQVAFRLDFEGDVFETEDQRNWTDASFKTYSTPLSKPFPVTHHPGDTVRQSIRLSAREVVPIHAQAVGTVPVLSTSAVAAALEGQALPAPLAAGLGPLLAEVALEADEAFSVVTPSQALALAERLGLALDIRIVASTPEDAARIVRSLPLDRITHLGVYAKTSHVTESALWEAVVAEAKELGFQGELVAGARSHFTELNRNRSSARQDADAITFSITPQMHATEPGAIIESLAMQALTARDALRIGAGQPLHIGPVTLTRRFNAVATQPPLNEELPGHDALQDHPFAAAWLLGSVTALTGPGTASISYASAADLGSPAGQLLQQLATYRGSEVLVTDTRPEAVAVYPILTFEGVTAFVGNLTEYLLPVRLLNPSGIATDFALEPWQTTTIALPCPTSRKENKPCPSGL